MITAAVTAGIVAVLTSMGVEPGAYIAPLAVAVKIVVVTPLVGGILWWKKRKDAEAAASQAATP
jgi:hypothetical protein